VSLVFRAENQQKARLENAVWLVTVVKTLNFNFMFYAGIFSAVAAATLIKSLTLANSLERTVNSIPPPAMP
jgi:hypothetical protein